MTVRSNIGPFAMVPEELFKLVQEGTLTSVDIMVYIGLSMRADRSTGECWPSQKTIGNEIGKSAETVRKSLNRLREIGAVDWEHQYEDEAKTVLSSNRYTVNYTLTLPSPRGGVPSSARVGVPTSTREGVPSPAWEKPEPIYNHNQGNQITAPSAERKSGAISALEWDSSAAGREAVGKSLAVRFYGWCRSNQTKRPAVKHKAFVNLIDDLLERGYHEDEVWDLLQLHQRDGFPWTLNAIAVTESKLKKAQPAAQQELPDDWTEEEKAEYYRLKAGPDFMTQLLETGEIQ